MPLYSCPRCHKGALYQSYLRVVDHCANCNLPLKGEDAADGPAFFVMSIVSFLVVPLALWTEMRFEPAYWVHLVCWPVVILALCLGLLPLVKYWMIGQEYRKKVLNHDKN